VQADVVHRHGGAVGLAPFTAKLELAREVRKLGMKRRPLAMILAPDERVHDLVLRDAGEMNPW